MFDEPHSPEWIDNALKRGSLNKGKFLTDNHFHSYYIQMKVINNLKVRKVLEIGPGENFAANYLKEFGFQYFTMDIEEKSNPSILSSIENFNTQDYLNDYDLVCAFQVLEHSPYKNFVPNLKKMAEMSKKYVFISIPYSGFGIKLSLNIHFNQNLRPTRALKMFLPSMKKNRIYRPEYVDEFPWAVHYWEIGRKGFPLRRIKNDIQKTGLSIKKTFHSNNLFHYYILAEK
ncbi:MAG: hypothetical protein DRJ10_06140 [Bacteroidetes bacterium]|nr:MAG: hypothetical protein DRJ10_06140 [Bacteroidota bacterium]